MASTLTLSACPLVRPTAEQATFPTIITPKAALLLAHPGSLFLLQMGTRFLSWDEIDNLAGRLK